MTNSIKEIKVGNKVSLNNKKDATWFTVVAVDGFNVTIKEKDLYREQVIDKSLIVRVKVS